MGMNLFDGSDPDVDDLSKIEIDTEFARRYEHNKKREDLQRYEELKKMGLVSDQSKNEKNDSEASDDEDNNDSVLVRSKEKDLEFFNALLMVKKQLPILENKELELFESEPEDVGEDSDLDKKKEKVQKKIYLKDVIAKHLTEAPEFIDKDEDDDARKNKILSYNEEQEEIRKAFLSAVEANVGEDDEGDLFQVKEKARPDEDGELQEKLDEYFGGGRGDFDENAMFLKEYFMKKMWVDDKGGVKHVDNGDEELNMLSDDEKEIERQEEYEYRFQEKAGDLVTGHSRVVEDSVRKKVKARTEQRKRKEERMEIARLAREEELRHLKNLKKKEMDEKVKRIMATAGISEEEVVPLSSKLLEEEFDPEEYDKMMKKTFGEEYYDAEDADPGFGSDVEGAEDGGKIEKPDFEKEDELLGLQEGWDHAEDDDLIAARERSLKHKMENDNDNEDCDYEKETEMAEEGKRKRKRKKVALLEKAKQAMMDEYYELDYEDVIGDLKTRFKYAKTKPNRYGLSTDELLVMDDMELSQYVSMKKLAPYREEEWKLPNSKRYQLKMRTRELLRGETSKDHTSGKKKIKHNANKSTTSSVTVNDEKEKLQIEDSKCDTTKLSKKARRKQRQGQFKPSRLMLYGKMDPKPKKKQKH